MIILEQKKREEATRSVDIGKYEGGLKIFRPSLKPTKNSGQAAVGMDPDRSRCHLDNS